MDRVETRVHPCPGSGSWCGGRGGSRASRVGRRTAGDTPAARSSFPVRVDDRDPGDAQEVRVFGDYRVYPGLDRRCGEEGVPEVDVVPVANLVGGEDGPAAVTENVLEVRGG